MNLMVVTDKNYLVHTYVMLFSFFKYHKEIWVDVYLPYEGLPKEDIEKLSEFISSFGNGRLIPLYVGEAFRNRVVSQSNISVETYYRILAIDLLPADMEKILYMDVDLCVKAPLFELYDVEMGGNLFVVCDDIIARLNGFYDENKMRLSIPAGYQYFNAGVMLFNIKELRRINAASQMLDCIYKDYRRYLYNDQDVMNELYYDRLIFTGWDMYNCPPAWYFLDKAAMAAGRLDFATYETIRRFQEDTTLMDNYLNITSQIYESAKVVHYLGDLKPWSTTREAAVIFEIFDKAYNENRLEVTDYCKRLAD